MKNQSDINTFIGFFKDEIARISRVRRSLYKKILFACLLDTIGKARFPNGSNRERIVSFITACSGSLDMNRVSLVHVIFHLNYVLTDSQKSKSRLYQFAQQQKAKMTQGRIYRGHEVDPFFYDIEHHACKHEKKALRFARYDELFFEYRHKLVHNFKEPGYPIEMSRDGTNPYYHSYINGPWQLVFPAGFFRVLVKDCLTGLQAYLLKTDINPYDSYEFGDMWIPKEKLKPKKKKK